jgi:hypothetical protein
MSPLQRQHTIRFEPARLQVVSEGTHSAFMSWWLSLALTVAKQEPRKMSWLESKLVSRDVLDPHVHLITRILHDVPMHNLYNALQHLIGVYLVP